jgi:hypothetical protein
MSEKDEEERQMRDQASLSLSLSLSQAFVASVWSGKYYSKSKGEKHVLCEVPFYPPRITCPECAKDRFPEKIPLNKKVDPRENYLKR